MRSIFTLFILISSFATAQVTDNFTDGDFTTAPVWSGDAPEFIVNAAQQLQLNNSVAGASYLSTASPGSSINNIQWSFYIKQTFAPSGSNYGRVYLVSDQANLEGALNGYYLQFGEAGSLDAVELFRQTGLTSTSVCRGTNGEVALSFSIGIKVTRNASGNWNLYVDPAGGAAYGLEATGTDLTHTTTSFFGVASVYTISSSTKFFFDDFYNGAIIVDITAPAIVSSTVISNTELDVLFNENVDLATSQVLTNYSADNGLGSPSVATRDVTNLSLVHLTFATPFTNALLNTLTVTNVQDMSANAITSATTTFTYLAPVSAVYRDIVINEIFADPSPVVGLPGVEFIELYNNTFVTYNLNGWKFTDGSTTATIGSFVLGPNQYVIICPIADTALFTSFGNRIGITSFPSLNNAGDNLKLLDNTLAVIDSVNYSDAWYQDVIKKDGGWTLELINPSAPASCPVTGNWIASTNVIGGTPGTLNSVYSNAADIISPTIASVTVVDSLNVTVCFSEALDPSQIAVAGNYSISGGIGVPSVAAANITLTCVDLVLTSPLNSSGTYTITLSNQSDCSGNILTPATANFSYYIVKPFDVVINEIMADPDPVITTLPNDEYIELYNRTAYPINLNNWKFTAGSNTKLLPNVIIPADSFIVLISTTTTGMPTGINIGAVTSFPSLTNTAQTLTLRTPEGAVISTVSYNDNWYQDAAKQDGGYSLEQIDPSNPCAGMNNWKASNSSNGGTPGKQNSVYAANPDNTPPQVVRVSVIAADTILLYFNEPLDSTTMLNPAIYTIDNSIGVPIQVAVIGPDFKSVRLALGSNLIIGTIYTITVNSFVTDCAGNTIGTPNSARFAIPEPAAIYDIAINEILFNPKTGGVDFVEIYNRSDKVIDLKSISISTYDTITNAILSPLNVSSDGYLLFPQEYLVVSENGSGVKTQYNTTNPQGFIDTDLPTMNDDEGTLCLSSAGLIIDKFKYYADMHFGLFTTAEREGISLERIDYGRPTQDRTNWHSAAEAVGFATPGYKNSQYSDAGETESAIEITPEIFSPDEDGVNDVVNINYHFDTPGFTANVTIYDSKGRIVKLLIRNELLGTKGTFSWDGINDDREKARIGIYIVYFEVFDLTGNVKRYKKTCVVAGKL